MSVISTTAGSPNIIPAPPSPTRSISIDIYHSEPNPNRTIDLFDGPLSDQDEDGLDDRRYGSQSNNPHITRKSTPAPRHPSGLEISQPMIVASSTRFEPTAPEMSSIMGVESPRTSKVSMDTDCDCGSGGSHLFSTLKAEDSVSPRTTLVGMKNVGRAISTDRSRVSNTSPKSLEENSGPQRTSPIGSKILRKSLPTMADSGAGPREIGGFRLPFIPRLFRSTGLPKEAPPHSEGREVEPAPEEEPRSFFDDASSEEGADGEGAQIENAQQAIVGTPVMVKHGSSTRVGLKDMLRSSPPAEDNPGPSRAKAMRTLGEDVDLRRPSNQIEAILGIPQAQQEDKFSGNSDGHGGRQVGLGIFKTLNPFADNGLRSNPPPVRSPPVGPTARKVSFPPPPKLDIKTQHRFLRQDIVSTPYPPGFHERGEYKDSEQGTVRTVDEGLKSLLTLVLYSHGDSVAKVKKAIIPTSQQRTYVDDSDEKKPPIKATMSDDFDDEKLYKLIRSEYTSMRGSLRQLASARTVRSMNLLAYRSTSQLVSKHAKAMHFRNQDEEEYLAEARMLDLFKKPKIGRKHHEWVEWVTTLPENSHVEPVDNERIALELVEGWSLSKFLFAVITVLIFSLLATLLWIFLGLGSDKWTYEGPADRFLRGIQDISQHVESPTGFRGAGGRVEAGVAIGVLTLMFGWTGIGAWLLLNYLVM